ncbi:MAG: YozE family protein [Lactobacillus sp.]|uniref:UPF0346 protein DS831_06930 n=1 Tax=Bombilactobacillus bombi TaxID=1303590 RepID=A0A347SRB0_9LACO|nr:YozE family protein [Bombilactobacillus bombi]AXX64569.1 YozE family protein [Bombilactobacillus bombi]MCO6542869.1 YozE family protein [Lactobacillus sp.]RHW46959.1 YozE family protein [Bombilactobacillus bombi]RHW49890.1 YozE family protein [Bombilactobacillus bombi]
MGKTFYEYLMTQRNPNSSDPIAHFADAAFFDSAFPKQSQDYDEISNYLELNGSYLPTMDIFDLAFRNYQETLEHFN